MDTHLENALTLLEEELSLAAPLGASKNNPRLRYLFVLEEIRKRICPHAAQILKTADSKEAELATIVTDALLSYVTALPFVATTVAKYLCISGLSKFCEDPGSILDGLAADDE